MIYDNSDNVAVALGPSGFLVSLISTTCYLIDHGAKKTRIARLSAELAEQRRLKAASDAGC